MKVIRPATAQLLGQYFAAQANLRVGSIGRVSQDLIDGQAGVRVSRVAEDLCFAQIADKKCSNTSPEQIVQMMKMREYRASESI